MRDMKITDAVPAEKAPRWGSLAPVPKKNHTSFQVAYVFFRCAKFEIKSGSSNSSIVFTQKT